MQVGRYGNGEDVAQHVPTIKLAADSQHITKRLQTLTWLRIRSSSVQLHFSKRMIAL